MLLLLLLLHLHPHAMLAKVARTVALAGSTTQL
jgi:hypothetical protein